VKFIKKPDASFRDLDTVYQNHFVREFFIALALYVLGIVLCFAFFRRLTNFLILTGVFLVYVVYLLYLIYESLIGKIVAIDAVCVDVKRKELKPNANTTVIDVLGLNANSCEIVLKDEEGNMFNQSVPMSSNYTINSTVRIYGHKSSIKQINANTYTVINPVFMHVLTT